MIVLRDRGTTIGTAACAAVFVALVALAMPGARDASASTVAVGNAPPQVNLRIGDASTTQSLVSFAVPYLNVGDGTAVAGTSTAVGGTCAANSILVDAQARYTPPARTVQLTVNSSASLVGPAGTIPMTQITWTASGYAPITLPSGAFTGSAAQLLASFQTSNRLRQCLTFTYLNSVLVGSGTYSGTVTFTLTML